MNPISTIENFDAADGNFGQEVGREKIFNLEGH